MTGPPAETREEKVDDIQEVLSHALPREQVILNAHDDRITGIERVDVMVLPKEDWLRLLIWIAAHA